MNNLRTVGVIGGGISGLSTAFALCEQAAAAGIPIHCTVVDAASDWGGKIVTHRVGDLVTEAGPDSFLSQKPAGLELCDKLGLTDQLMKLIIELRATSRTEKNFTMADAIRKGLEQLGVTLEDRTDGTIWRKE